MKVGGPWFGGAKTAPRKEGPSGRPTHKLRALVKSRTTDQLEAPAAPGIHNVHDLIAVRCPVPCEQAPQQHRPYDAGQAELGSAPGFCFDRVTMK